MNGAPACWACAGREPAAVTSPARPAGEKVLAGPGLAGPGLTGTGVATMAAIRQDGVTGDEGAPATPVPVELATAAPWPASPPATPDPLPAAPSVSKYDLKAPAPGAGGRRIMLISAALVLVLAGTGGVAALVTASGPGTGARGQLLTEPGGQNAAPGGPAAGRGAAKAGHRNAGAGRPPVVLAPAVRNQPGARPASRFLVRYFRAINHHDYRAYLRLFAPASRAALSPSRFLAGYGTTRDAAARLMRLTPAGSGQLAATVTFTSHQDESASPAHASCLRWRITVYLIRHGTGAGRYFIGTPPAGYAARERAC